MARSRTSRSSRHLVGRASAPWWCDVIDAALVLLATDADEILTSDPDDIVILALASGVHADVVRL